MGVPLTPAGMNRTPLDVALHLLISRQRECEQTTDLIQGAFIKSVQDWTLLLAIKTYLLTAIVGKTFRW